MRAILRLEKEIHNFNRDCKDVSVHFLFTVIDTKIDWSKAEINENTGRYKNPNAKREVMSAYLLLRTLPNSIYGQNIYCLKFSITEKYPIEAPDVVFVKGKELIKTLEDVFACKIKIDDDLPLVSEKGVHCQQMLEVRESPDFLQQRKAKIKSIGTRGDLDWLKEKVDLCQPGIFYTDLDHDRWHLELLEKINNLFDLKDFSCFVHCKEPIVPKKKKTSFFSELKNLFKSDGEHREEESQSEITQNSSNSPTEQTLENKIQRPENCDKRDFGQLGCCRISIQAIMNFLYQIKIPRHPHIYSNGHICSSLMKDWVPVHNMTIISLSYLAALNENKEHTTPENDGIYSFFNRKGSRNTKWAYEGEM